jgi:hemoglobin/transferrin/lactoferrin receptor protein
MPRRLTTRLLAATALCAATGAQAQQADGPVLLDRIILGFGTPRVAIDTPQAVTVIDQEDIDRQQPTTPAELLDGVPGVQAIGSNRPAGVSFNIRGIGESLSSDESRIVVTVDGATKFHEQYRVGSFFGDPELYKRVEVLRGPASSTLVGAGAIGGAIAFETKDAADFLGPGTDNALRFRLGATSNGAGGFGTVTYAGRLSERAELLASLTYRRADAYEDGDGDTVDGSEFDSLAGLLKGTFRLPEERMLSLTYSVFDSDLDDTTLTQTESAAFFGEIDRHIRDQTLTLRYQDPRPGNPALDIDVTAYVSDSDVDQGDTGGAPPGTPPSFVPLFDDVTYGYRTVGIRAENTSVLGFGDAAFLTVGVQASRQDRIADRVGGAPEFHPEGTDTRLGLYAQAELTFGAVTLIPGLRVDRFWLSPEGDVPGAEDREETAVAPKIAAIWEVLPEWSVFGSLSRTERVPTLDELFATNFAPGFGGIVAVEGPSLDLRPETSDAVEIGASYARDGVFGADDVLAVKATAFRYEIDDLIERDSRPDTPFYRNVGRARLEGVEIEGSYEADRAFGRLAYTFVNGEDRDTGADLTSVPGESLVLTLGGRNATRTWEYGWQGTFVDDAIRAAQGGPERTAGYAVHDVFAGYTPDAGALEGWEVRAGIDNLFDRDYRNNLAGDDGPGRTFELTLTRAIDW